MKSGPTLNGATRLPDLRSAPIKPVATVVFPLPDAGAAMTTAGVLISRSYRDRPCLHADTPQILAFCGRSRGRGSPLDALLALAAGIHRVLDLRHLGHQIRGVEQLLRRVAAGDHDVLGAGPG